MGDIVGTGVPDCPNKRLCKIWFQCREQPMCCSVKKLNFAVFMRNEQARSLRQNPLFMGFFKDCANHLSVLTFYGMSRRHPLQCYPKIVQKITIYRYLSGCGTRLGRSYKTCFDKNYLCLSGRGTVFSPLGKTCSDKNYLTDIFINIKSATKVFFALLLQIFYFYYYLKGFNKFCFLQPLSFAF